MVWTEAQRAMLQELGVWPGWPAPTVQQPEIAHAPQAAAAGATVAAQNQDREKSRDAGAGVDAPASAIASTLAPATVARAAPGPTLAAPALAPQLANPHPAPDWPSLQQAVVACQACGLCKSRTQTVFGVGHLQAHWMVVGEAPGQHEDEQGEPFVGAAGQLLDAMLRALGLTRETEGEPAQRVYIANTLKCRPPGNRNPQPEELAQCEPFLLRQLELVRPRIVLAMGRFAVQSLLRTSEPIGKLRGQVHQIQGVPLVVTYHPAYLLRNLTEKARAWEDLCLAAAQLRAN